MSRTNSTIDVTYVFLLHPDDLDQVDENTCMAAGCGYQPRPCRPGNLRMDLWSACALVTDRDHAELSSDGDGKLWLGVEDVRWVTLCGDSDDRGFVSYPDDEPEGHYGGNGCLTRLGDRKVACVPFEYPYDD